MQRRREGRSSTILSPAKEHRDNIKQESGSFKRREKNNQREGRECWTCNHLGKLDRETGRERRGSRGPSHGRKISDPDHIVRHSRLDVLRRLVGIFLSANIRKLAKAKVSEKNEKLTLV